MTSAKSWPFDNLVQDCSISIVNALEILQSFTRTLISCLLVELTIVDSHSADLQQAWHPLGCTALLLLQDVIQDLVERLQEQTVTVDGHWKVANESKEK